MDVETDQKKSLWKQHRLFLFLTGTGQVVLLLLLIILFSICVKPGLIVGILQRGLDIEGSPINSYEPDKETGEELLDNGILYVNDISYGESYPNSYLDILYPDGREQAQKPTIVYLHGGSFFAGDKSADNVMALHRLDYLYEQMALEGYNFVTINYVLIPEGHFPDPLLQINQALNYLVSHQSELRLDMSDVTLFGHSSGASFVAQYGALLSSQEYRDLFPFIPDPLLTPENIRALVVDDVPLDIRYLGPLPVRFVFGAYLNSSLLLLDRQKNKAYSCLRFVTENYPRTFLSCATAYGIQKSFPYMAQRLTDLGVENEFYYPDEAVYGKTEPGFLLELTP